ncbi:CPXV012 protein [Cowpox virus]|uniref:CPXV012 protein n=1 Tax=Cowpox virus TaxID=10243 RepID=A0A1X9T7H5_COWPX|nr:CPXV012 protein [Cowpox virus]
MFIMRESIYRVVIVILSLALISSFLVICSMEHGYFQEGISRFKICPYHWYKQHMSLLFRRYYHKLDSII